MKLLERKTVRLLMIFCLMFTLVVSSGGFNNLLIYAYEKQTGMIRSDGGIVFTREEPNDASNEMNGLKYGKPVTVIDETIGADGQKWYKITYKLKKDNQIVTAYCRASNVLLDKNVTVSANGSITKNEVYLRDDAGTDGTVKLATLHKGYSIEILDQTKVDDTTWYRARYKTNGTTYIGWVMSTYVSIDKYMYEPDADFEEQLRQLGFPESYIDSLAALHAKYPKWQFVPVFTGLDWNEVIANESKPGLNVVQTKEDDAKKSVAATEYNWETNEWVIRDNTYWVTVHPDYLAYCMDPRNFLNETDIFQFESLSYSSSQNIAGVKSILKNTFMENDVKDKDGTVFNYANTLMQIGKEINVSPYHLAARLRQEQGLYGTSSLISGNYPGYEGYYNYFNINAYGTPESVVITNGLSYAKKHGWDTRYKSILGGAKHIATSFIGRGQDTLYFQKFNVVFREQLYNHQYMQNVKAAIVEGQSVAKTYTDKNQTFVFRIPIYENMPKSAVRFTATGNRNNYLKSLNVVGLSLTPTFKGSTTNYSLVVDNGVSSITVSARPVVSKATVSGTGTYNLKVGTNTIKIYCKSESGETRTYTLTVSRQAAGNGGNTSYSWSSDTYKIGTYISGIAPGTTASQLLSRFQTTNCTMKLFNANGTENKGVIATGNKIAIYVNGSWVETKEIVIYGDTNGDGEIDILDLIKANRHSLGTGALKGAYLEAGDANRKGDGVDILDIIIMNRHSLGLTTIKQ